MMHIRNALLAALVLALATTGQATQLVPASLEELTRDATAIARGRVVAMEARLSDDRRGIETVVTLAVDATLKGDAATTLQFVIPGGLLGRYRTIVVGAPSFALNESVIVFVGGRAPALPHIVGFSQGVYRVVSTREPAASDRVRTDVFGAGIAPVAGGAGTTGSMALQDFEGRVRSIARRRP